MKTETPRFQHVFMGYKLLSAEGSLRSTTGTGSTKLELKA